MGGQVTDTRVAFVVGASRGIGRSCAVHLARRGFDVVVAARTVREPGKDGERARRIPGSLESTAEDIRAVGQRAFIAPLDLLDRTSCADAVDKALGEFGRVDVLVNSGIYYSKTEMLPFEAMPIEEYDFAFAGNVIAPLFLIQRLLPTMKALGGGVVIHISSGAGQNETPAQPGQGGWGLDYSLTKAAYNRIAAGLGKELKQYNIAVVNLEPGFVATERMTIVLKEYGIDASGGLSMDVPGAVCAYIASHPTPMTFSGRTVDAPQFASWCQLLDATTFPHPYGPTNWGHPPAIPIAGLAAGVATGVPE